MSKLTRSKEVEKKLESSPAYLRRYIENLERTIDELRDSNEKRAAGKTAIAWYDRLDHIEKGDSGLVFLPDDAVIRVFNDGTEFPVEIDLSTWNSGEPGKRLLRVRTLLGSIYIHPEASNVVVVRSELKPTP